MQRYSKRLPDGSTIQVWRDLFTYTVSFDTLAPGADITDTITTTTDADFIWLKSCYTVFTGLANGLTEETQVVPLLDMTINDSGSGRNLQQEPVFVASQAGRGQLPYILPVPRVFKGNSNVGFNFRNFSTGDTYQQFKFHLLGYKEWR